MRPMAVVAASVLAASCSGGGSTTVAPVLDEVAGATFVSGIDHPFFPFTPGSTWSYRGEEDGEVEIIEVMVLDETRVVAGITAVVVRDTVTLDGELVEDTFDWYAQDADGNVWYLGEDSKEYENGEVVSTAGSWETGVDGAQPGIIMYRDPAAHLGVPYRQEFYPGEAEDVAEIIETGATITIGDTVYSGVVVISEWNPLDAGVVENKYFAPGVGVVLEEVVEGGSGRVELVSHSQP